MATQTNTILQPTITQAGLQALINSDANGLEAKITSVGLGSSGYAPSPTDTRLRNQVHKIALASGQKVSPTQLHLSVIDDTSHEFWVREVGFYLEDGTLFAIYSDAEKTLAYKSPDVDLLLAFDLSIEAASADRININSPANHSINILLAPELAKMATAQINNMHRDIHRTFLLMDKGIL